jgi:hypothetical protein
VSLLTVLFLPVSVTERGKGSVGDGTMGPLEIGKTKSNGLYHEISLFAGRWMELESIILSEVSQAQKTKDCVL